MQAEEVKTLHVISNEQMADLSTKPLGEARFKALLHKMGVRNIYSPS